MKNHRLTFPAIVVLAIWAVAFAQIVMAKGPPNKVEVTAANPSEATQGQELDVVISGSGFDSGSSVSYLVTGTKDDSQVDVLSVEYISDTELKTRIRPKDAALVTDYDIEVQSSSGRKGKGTTLFRVKSAQCYDNVFPSMAYVARSEFVRKKGRTKAPIPLNFIISGDNGCTTQTLVSDYQPLGGSFRGMRFVVRDGLGLLSWMDTTEMDAFGVSYRRIYGVYFDVLPGGQIQPEAPVPVLLYESIRGAEDNLFVVSYDAWIDAAGNTKIAFVDFEFSDERNLKVLDVTSGAVELLLSGPVHLVSQSGDPFKAGGAVSWSPDGDSIYFSVSRSDVEYVEPGIGRMVLQSGVWQAPQLVVLNHQDGNYGISYAGVSLDGLLAYNYAVHDGPNTWMVTGLLDPEVCVAVTCDVLDGAPPPGVSRDGTPVSWTVTGSLIFSRIEGGSPVYKEWSDPELGLESEILLRDVDFLDSSL